MKTQAMKILLAVDGSDSSLAAAAEAGRMLWPAGSVVKILAVADAPTPATPWMMPLPSGSYATWEKIFEDRAIANLASALARFNEANKAECVVMTKVIHGPVKEAILDEAEHWGSDLIILGTHGYNIFERVWLGSVSRGIASHAQCSVRVVRGAPNPEKRAVKILLAVDGSECSNTAVETVAARPWAAGSEVRVLSVLHLPFTPTPETWSLPDSFYFELEKKGRESLEATVSRAAERLEESNSERTDPLTVSSAVILGHPEEEIIREAKKWGADLIVLGSHGLSGWKRFMLGSVSHAVASHAPCSVEIVR